MIYKKNYPELRGNRVKLSHLKGERVGIVIGCNYNEGITIVDEETEEKIVCLNSKIHYGELYSKRQYAIMFLLYVGCIYKGEITVTDDRRVDAIAERECGTNTPSILQCAYE